MSNPSKAREKAKELLNKIEGMLGHSLPSAGEEYYRETYEIAGFHCDEIIAFATNHLGLDDYTVKFYNDVKKEIQSL